MPECIINPSSQYQLVNKNYVDLLPLHQTVSGIISYLSIYQTKSDMINYLTISSAKQIYIPKSDIINYVNTSSNQNINGVKSFGSLPECIINPTSQYQLVNKLC